MSALRTHTPHGIKLSNEYQRAFGSLYAKTPKAVLAAVAFSFAWRDSEGVGIEEALSYITDEWWKLHQNGIVQQRPPKDAISRTRRPPTRPRQTDA